MMYTKTFFSYNESQWGQKKNWDLFINDLQYKCKFSQKKKKNFYRFKTKKMFLVKNCCDVKTNSIMSYYICFN